LSTPSDAAFSVLKPEEDVRKFVPLIPLALAGYGGYRGAQNLRNQEVSNPLFGTKMAEGDDTYGSKFLQFGSGALEGYMPMGTATAAARIAGRRAAARQATRQAQHAATKRQFGAKTADKIHPAKVRQTGLTGKARDRFGAMKIKPSMTTAGAGLTAGALLEGDNLEEAVAALGMSLLPEQESHMPQQHMGGGMGGGGTGQGQYGHGDPSGGLQNLENVGTHGMVDHDIFAQKQGSNWTNQQKGETMTFTHYEGNEMLRKTLEDLDKMHCGTEQKAEEDKGDKKSKKPAHGMVIVIGSKNAGPGPSTDGKRDSKD
jgi:hypothetical protein